MPVEIILNFGHHFSIKLNINVYFWRLQFPKTWQIWLPILPLAKWLPIIHSGPPATKGGVRYHVSDPVQRQHTRDYPHSQYHCSVSNCQYCVCHQRRLKLNLLSEALLEYVSHCIYFCWLYQNLHMFGEDSTKITTICITLVLLEQNTY